MPLDRTKPQIRFGVESGLTAAVILILLLGVARILGADDSTLPVGINLSEQILLFLGGGLGGGLVLGLLMPLSQSKAGGALLGALVMAPFYLGQWWLSVTAEVPRMPLGAVGLAIFLVGGISGYWAVKDLEEKG